MGSQESCKDWSHCWESLDYQHVVIVIQLQEFRNGMHAILSLSKFKLFEYVTNRSLSLGKLLIYKVSQLRVARLRWLRINLSGLTTYVLILERGHRRGYKSNYSHNSQQSHLLKWTLHFPKLPSELLILWKMLQYSPMSSPQSTLSKVEASDS